MRKGKFIILIVVAFCLYVSCQTSSEKVEFQFQNVNFYQAQTYARFNFKLINHTTDTQYVSLNNLIIEVKKDGQVLQNHPQHAFPPLGMVNDLDVQELRHSQVTMAIKSRFAKKLIAANFGNKKKYFDVKWLTEQVIDNCIVLLPNQSIPYTSYYWNNALDESCNISGKVLNSKKYMQFEDDKHTLQLVSYP